MLLCLAGMEHNPRCTSAVTDSIEAIKSHLVLWENLQWREERRLDDLRRGINISGRVIHHVADGNVECLVLESKLRGIEPSSWCLPRAHSAFIQTVAIDQAQGILVLAERPNQKYVSDSSFLCITHFSSSSGEYQIRIRTLTSNKAYPGVEDPILVIPEDSEAPMRYITAMLHGDHLAVSTPSVFSSRGSLIVCNWKTCDVQLVSAFLTSKLPNLMQLSAYQSCSSQLCIHRRFLLYDTVSQ